MVRWKRVCGFPTRRQLKRSRPELPGKDWSCLPDPAIYLIMKALLPDMSDVFAAGRVCRTWKSVLTTSKRALLSAVPPLAVSWDVQTLCFLTEGDRCYRREQAPRGAGRRWVTPMVLAASHGCLVVAEVKNHRLSAWRNREPEHPLHQVFLLEAVSVDATEENPLIPLPRITFDAYHCSFLLTAPPTSPRCVVVALQDRKRVLCCRVGDDEWTCHDVLRGHDDNGAQAALYELCAIETRLLAFLDGKLYGATRDGRLLVVDSFLPQLSVSVLDVKGFPPEDDSIIVDFMVESGGDILFAYEESIPNGCKDDEEGEHRFAVLRLDLRAREWVRADGFVGDGPRALLLNDQGQSLSWDASGSGSQGCVYAYCYETGKMAVFHMKHGFVEHRAISVEENFILPSICYRSGITRPSSLPLLQ